MTHAFRDEHQDITDPVVPPATNSNHLVGHAIDFNLDTPSGWCNGDCLYGELYKIVKIRTECDSLKMIQSLSYSRYYLEACNEWRDPSPRPSAWITQLRRNITAVASHWRHCIDLNRSGIEPKPHSPITMCLTPLHHPYGIYVNHNGNGCCQFESCKVYSAKETKKNRNDKSKSKNSSLISYKSIHPTSHGIEMLGGPNSSNCPRAP